MTVINKKNDVKFCSTEPSAVEQHNQFPILAKAGRGAADKSLHLQCDKSGRLPGRREAPTGGGRSFRVPRGYGEDKHSVPRQLHRVVPAQEDPAVCARAECGQESQDSHTKYSVAGTFITKYYFIGIGIYPLYSKYPSAITDCSVSTNIHLNAEEWQILSIVQYT